MTEFLVTHAPSGVAQTLIAASFAFVVCYWLGSRATRHESGRATEVAHLRRTGWGFVPMPGERRRLRKYTADAAVTWLKSLDASDPKAHETADRIISSLLPEEVRNAYHGVQHRTPFGR